VFIFTVSLVECFLFRCVAAFWLFVCCIRCMLLCGRPSCLLQVDREIILKKQNLQNTTGLVRLVVVAITSKKWRNGQSVSQAGRR
jgi:hypothetical protein